MNNLESIKGLGPKTLQCLNNLGINNIDDLVNYYPYRHDIIVLNDIKTAVDKQNVVIECIVDSVPLTRRFRANMTSLTFRAMSNKKMIAVVIFNRAFLKTHIKPGSVVTVIGKYDALKNTVIASDIKFEKLVSGSVESIYHLTSGLTSKQLKKYIAEVLPKYDNYTDYIPDYLNQKYNFISKKDAVNMIHLPKNEEEVKKALIKLKYEELFEFMFKINYLKEINKESKAGYIRNIDPEEVNSFIRELPFELTTDQDKAVLEIYKDMTSSRRMNRMLQGDVGSGKTIISFLALFMNYLSGYQGVLMAPTEILIKQHYENIKKILTDLNIEILTGSTTKKDRDKIIENLKNGQIDILLSTHSVLNDDVVFKNIGLVVTDEQHRFGVNQRKNLQNKGENVDVLYMSATPIPRTLALTIFKDMDITEIKTKPLNRKPKITKLYKTSEIKEVLYEMLDEIKKGHQIYVVSPLIENEEENTKLASVNYLYEKINVALNGKVPIGVLHGKLKNEEKENIMNDFKSNKTKILISTTIIEIGVDVSNATMIVIFNAERFGLATLHQLRGRIGRNDIESKCILISDYDTPRLKILEESEDGFYISEKDFELRGAGDLFGVKQSGDMVFKIANLNKDFKILKKCSEDSLNFLNKHINEIDKFPIQKNIIRGVKNLN